MGVQVPHVNTAEEARQVIAAVKYHPLGQRGGRALVHERFEALIKAGALSEDEIWKAANVLSALPQFDPANIRDEGERRVATLLRKIALDGALDPQGGEGHDRGAELDLDAIGRATGCHGLCGTVRHRICIGKTLDVIWRCA